MINRVPRSQKLRFYESLFLWNQSVDQVIATLREMEKFPFARKEALQHAQAEIEELRADVNGDFLEDIVRPPTRRRGPLLKAATRLRNQT